MVRFGLVARAEDRGLGSLSRDFYTHLQPDATLVIVPRGVRRHGLESHLDWFPDATIGRFDGHLNEQVCRGWLADLDVVLMFETAYDWRFCHWAHEAHTATICYAMPEWWRPQWAGYPTQWWAPTTYRLEHLHAGTGHVPIPMTAPTRERRTLTPFRWLHVAGAQTEADRNGTIAVLAAARKCEARQEILIRTQSPLDLKTPDNVIMCHDSLSSRWALYDDVDALLMPRRYAGLSLPVLEAMAAGLPVVMTNLPPQNVDWPVQTVSTTHGEPLRLFGGKIATGDAAPDALAALMDRWATDPNEVDRWAGRVSEYAQANSWAIRGPEIRAELERVADLVTA